MSAPTHYSRPQIILHWIVVLLVAFNLSLSDGMEAMFRASQKGTDLSANDALLGNLHIYAGIAVLIFALARLYLRLAKGVPAVPKGPRLQELAGSLVHWGIYALIFLIPMSGMVAWFGGVELAGEGHGLLQNVLLILVILHVAAALYHQFVVKDNLLARMWRSH